MVRFPYAAGDLKARGKPEMIIAKMPGGGLLRGGGHWTRDIAFSLDGKKMFVSVGSQSNNDDTDDNPAEHHRAAILEFNPTAAACACSPRASATRSGIAVHPRTGELWASVNERDGLGDNLVPDYITRVKDGGFYGWPWYYIGGNQDPRHARQTPRAQGEGDRPRRAAASRTTPRCS